MLYPLPNQQPVGDKFLSDAEPFTLAPPPEFIQQRCSQAGILCEAAAEKVRLLGLEALVYHLLLIRLKKKRHV